MFGRPGFFAGFAPTPPVTRRLAAWLAVLLAYSAAVAAAGPWPGTRAFDWGSEATVLGGVVLGLLLAFRNKAAYDRWWEGRALWGRLVNESRNLALKVRASVALEADERRDFGRLLVGFADALRLHLRRPTALRDVPGFGADERNPAHVPLFLAGAAIDRLAAWRSQGKIDGLTALMLDGHAAALMDVCGGCERIRNTPMAPSYLALLRQLIVLYVVLAPWYVGRDLGWWRLPLLATEFYFFLGVEFVAEEIEEPFGDHGDDLATDAICRTIAASVGQAWGIRPAR